MTRNRYSVISTLNLTISIAGLLIVFLLTLNPPTTSENLAWRKPIIGFVFISICTFGIFAAVFPSECSKAFHYQRENTEPFSKKLRITSHHPDCEGFSAHVVNVRSRSLCAACTGLLFGALMCIIGSFLYFFAEWHLSNFGFLFLLIGALSLILGFLQFKTKGVVRLVLNMFFVLGAFLSLVGVDVAAESLIIDSFLIALIGFWIFTRIQLSQWDHMRICDNCLSPCDVQKNRSKTVS